MAKHYVVWEGRKPGIYSTWAECQNQTKGFKGARFKSFPTLAEAKMAFNDPSNKSTSTFVEDSISVDAACAGNPGVMEFQGVHTKTGEQLFHYGPFNLGTNNMGEFLGIVYGIQYLQKLEKHTTPIYSDSITALAWVRDKKVNSNLVRNEDTKELWIQVDNSIEWLKNNSYQNPLLKWDTNNWGEVKADFGRK